MLRDKTALVVSPGGRGEDSLERSGRDGGLCVGRPGEEDIAKVEDEGCRFREGHGYVLEGGVWGWEGREAIGKMRENLEILYRTHEAGEMMIGAD